jgi:hypothetical protein
MFIYSDIDSLQNIEAQQTSKPTCQIGLSEFPYLHNSIFSDPAADFRAGLRTPTYLVLILNS